MIEWIISLTDRNSLAHWLGAIWFCVLFGIIWAMIIAVAWELIQLIWKGKRDYSSWGHWFRDTVKDLVIAGITCGVYYIL